MTDMSMPACWTWPLTARHLERAFEASRSDPGRAAKLALVADWQDGRCAVCGSRRERLESDHDHDTGSFRGQLCGRCNKHEAHAPEDSPRFARYRFRPPAVILGVRIYWAKPDSARAILTELGPDPAAALQAYAEGRDPARRR